METWISTLETSVQPPGSSQITDLKALIGEKDARIEQLSQENRYLYAELERLQARIEEEFKRSEALINQMQAAAEESSKRAHAIIMHLSQQVEKQAEQIELLQQSQGFGDAVREKVQQLRARIPSVRIRSIKQALHSHFTTIR